MVFKFVQSAQKHRRALKGYDFMRDVVACIQFVDGLIQEAARPFCIHKIWQYIYPLSPYAHEGT